MIFIKANEDILYKAADLLIEKEKITGEEFDALFARTDGPAEQIIGPEELETRQI